MAGQEVVIILKQGSTSHKVSVPKDGTTVGDLVAKTEALTGIPASGQKLIVRGKALTMQEHGSCSLADCGLSSDGVKIMVLGKKYDPESDQIYKQILLVEQQTLETFQKLGKISHQLTDLENGHLAKEHLPEVLKRLSKACKVCSEDIMRSLETLDTIQLDGHQGVAKLKRKSVASTFNKYLDTADDILRRINELS